MNFFKIFFATLLAIIVSIAAIVALIVGGVTALLVNSTSTQTIKPNSVLVLDLKEAIVDSPINNPLSMVDFQNFTIRTQISTLDAIRAIEQAATDDKIKGIYIRSNMASGHSYALLEELRTEIINFRENSGKFIVAYGDSYSQEEYYLASVADSLYLQPEGMIVWQGVSANSIFFKGLLDKLDVDVEIFRPTDCTYKSAIEPLTRKNMSPESRQQNQMLIESMWATITADVAESRHLTPSLLNIYADKLVSFIAPEAKSSRFVDDLIYEDELEDVFKGLGVETHKDGSFNTVSLANYIGSFNNASTISSINSPINFSINALTNSSAKSSTKSSESSSESSSENSSESSSTAAIGSNNKVAVVYAEGTITDGVGEVGEVGGDTMAGILRKIRHDGSVKSVVLRVNSPGGSALAADVIWREVTLLCQTKPVIVSMGGYAASGGYYISAPADMIIANDLTITGSIGVYGVLVDLENTLSSKIGVTFDSAKSNSSSDFMQVLRPLTPTERAVMNRSVDQVYNTFTSHVSEGRNLSIERVHEISQGRVWSGADAQNIGLVDGIGGLKTAILYAAQRAGVAEDFEITQYSLNADDWSSIFSPMVNYLFSPMINNNDLFKRLRFMESKNGVVMFSPIRVE